MPENQASSAPTKVGDLVRKNGFKIGLGAIVVLIVLAMGPRLLHKVKGVSKNTNNPVVNMVGTKIETVDSANPSAQPKPAVRKLSFTSSYRYVRILNGDSYYSLTKRACGEGKFYRFVADLNGNKPLYEGDAIKVYCSF